MKDVGIVAGFLTLLIFGLYIFAVSDEMKTRETKILDRLDSIEWKLDATLESKNRINRLNADIEALAAPAK